MRYPGHDRIDAVRERLGELRASAARALDETQQLRVEMEALRREVADLTVAIGDQLAAMAEAIEDLAAGDRALDETQRIGPPTESRGEPRPL